MAVGVSEKDLEWQDFLCHYGDLYGEKIDPIPLAVGEDRYGKPKFMCRILYKGYKSDIHSVSVSISH